MREAEGEGGREGERESGRERRMWEGREGEMQARALERKRGCDESMHTVETSDEVLTTQTEEVIKRETARANKFKASGKSEEYKVSERTSEWQRASTLTTPFFLSTAFLEDLKMSKSHQCLLARVLACSFPRAHTRPLWP
jgi:hypothetical protein